MKKQYLPLVIFLLSNTILKAQSGVVYYINPELQEKVTMNHGVRLSSNELLRSRYEAINEKYEAINQKLTRILVIKEELHRYLTNVHSLIGESRILQGIFKDLGLVFSNLSKLSQKSAQNPQYAILVNKTYTSIYEQGLELQAFLYESILKENPKMLLDNIQRLTFLNQLRFKIRSLNNDIYGMILYLDNANQIPYWRQIDFLNSWYVTDEAMINGIINDAKYL